MSASLNTSQAKSSPVAPAPLQPLAVRPFGEIETEDPSTQVQNTPDLQTQFNHAALFGHGLLAPQPIQRQDSPDTDLDEDDKTPIQTKLTIGQPGDKYEQEADQVAAQVMRMPEVALGDDNTLQAKPLQAEPTIQAKSGAPAVTKNFENQLGQHKGGGQPLSDETRAYMEPRFGADFSNVRVHEAPTLASDIQAQAFTHGQDIYFNSGKYNPGSSSGKELLAHELTHTIQQTGGKLQRKTNKIYLKLGNSVPADRQARTQPQQDPPASNAEKSPAAPDSQAVEHPLQQQVADQSPTPVENQTADSVDSSASTEQTHTSQTAAPTADDSGGAPETQETQVAQETPDKPPDPSATPSQAPAPNHGSSDSKASETTSQPQTTEQQPTETSGNGGALGNTAAQPGQTLAPDASQTTGADSAAASETQAPASPEQDPDFQAVVSQAQGIATQEKQHAPATAASQAAQAASVSPANEIASQAQDQQVVDLDQQEAGSFDAAAFKQAVMDKVDAAAPKTLEDADQFKDKGLLGQIKDTLSGEAKTAGESAAAPIADKAEQDPDTSGITPRESTPLAPPEVGNAPPGLNAGAAKPKPKPDTEVSGPMQAESQNLDQQMAAADITEEQLANANEPQFTGALSAKQDAQTKATEAPQVYRQQEQATLTSAQAEAQTIGQTETQAMHSQREAAMGQLQGLQEGTKSQDEQKRSDVASHIDGIYQATKSSVDTILNGLEGEVMSRFNAGADRAKEAYEDYVREPMGEYKKRYEGPDGWIRWGVEKLWGVPSEVTAFFREGRKRYLAKMDGVLTDIATYVTDQLNQAKEKIKEGRQKIQDYVAGLPTNLQQVGQEAASNIQSQFDQLEQSVDDKHGQLIDALSQAYTKNLEELDARIDEMKASNQPWFAKAFDALTGVIETINKLKNMLLTVLAKVADTVGNIIKDPIGFLSNLVSGITQGLQNFLGNIWEHLQGGLVGWLTGALGPMGITIPEDLFSLSGIFSLVTQVLGLTWNYVRGKAVKMFGEPVVEGMEQGVEMIQVLREKGPEGMWEQVKEDFSDLQATVIDQIKNMVITKVITAGVKWIIGLLNPASAFVKACMTIYDIVMFFINQGSQVLELVNAVVEAVAAIARGATGGAAKLVENALVKALPVAIGFLASLLGIGGLTKKVQGIIKKIRKRIDKAINKLLKKAKKKAAKLLKKKGLRGEDNDNTTNSDPEHDAKVNKGLQQIKQEEKEYFQDGEKISREDAQKVAISIKRKNPIFKSITVIDGGKIWKYKYIASDGEYDGSEKLKITKAMRKKLGNMVDIAELKADEAIRQRGGEGSQIRRIGDYKDKTLAEIARMAVDGDAGAETAIKIIKQAKKKAQKYSGKN